MYSVTSYFYFPKRIPHSFSLYHMSSQMMGRSLKYISPAIVTCHDMIAFRVKANHPAFTEHMRRKHLAELRRAKAIIFISRHTRDDFLSLFDYREKDTAVIHHAAGDHFQPRDKKSSRKALELPKDRPIILHVGSEAPRKNIATLLYALHQIKQQIPAILFIRIGSQGRRSRELTARLRLEENISYFKNQPEEKLAKFYNAADVFVFPSTYE
ncbi:MAG: glycosyltransferase, partial [Fidelibacterota bacterium]